MLITDGMISPDGLIPDLNKGLEIKCPKMSTHIRYILEGGVPKEYIIQVQFSMWVTGYKEWDFVSYCPEYHKQTFFLFTVKRDEKLMKAFDDIVPQFISTLKAIKGV